MEASRLPREADVAPAPDPTAGRSAGWSPADPGPLGLAGFATTTFVLSMINADLVGGGALTAAGIVAPLALA
jgi:succinate-acetate transporter protein